MLFVFLSIMKVRAEISTNSNFICPYCNFRIWTGEKFLLLGLKNRRGHDHCVEKWCDGVVRPMIVIRREVFSIQ